MSEAAVSERLLYGELRDLLNEAGCFKPAWFQNALRLGFVILTFAVFFALAMTVNTAFLHVTTLFCLSILTLQCAFLGHDAFHGTLVPGQTCNDRWGAFLMSGIAGISYAMFYKKNHLEHHTHCGDTEHDPELDIAFFAFSPETVRGRQGLIRFTARFQGYLFFPILSLAVFLHRLRTVKFLIEHPLENQRDIVWFIGHFALWIVLPSQVIGIHLAIVNYLLCAWITGMCVATVFPFFHIGRPASQTKRSILARQIESTRNLGDSWPIEVLTGGNNNHIEHHLFPHIPTPRLRSARLITRSFCRERGLDYNEATHLEATQEIYEFLSGIAARVSPEQKNRDK